MAIPLLIIIDDIDRLTQGEICQLFQMIKAVVDFPNTVYLLAFDRSMVEAALCGTHGHYSNRFLEKIVQMEFDVPYPARSHIIKLFLCEFNSFAKVSNQDNADQDRWYALLYEIFPVLFVNLRVMKRYLNILAFKNNLFYGEINICDLLLLEAVRMLSVGVHDQIKINRDLLVVDSDLLSGIDRTEEDMQKHLDSIVALGEKSDHVILGRILRELFPIRDRRNYDASCVDAWEKQNRVCMKRNFDLYFQYIYSEGEVSRGEVMDFVNGLDNLTETVLKMKLYHQDNRLIKLCRQTEDYLEDRLDKTGIPNAINFLAAMARVLEEIVTPIDGIDYLYDTERAMSKIVRRLIVRLPKDQRKQWYIEFFQTAGDVLYLPMHLAYSFEWEREKLPESEWLLKAEEVEEIKMLLLPVIEQSVQSGSLFRIPQFRFLLMVWKNWAPESNPSSNIETFLKEDENIPVFVRGFLNYNASNGKKWAVVQKNEIQEYTDVSALQYRCERILQRHPEWLKEDGTQLLTLLVSQK